MFSEFKAKNHEWTVLSICLYLENLTMLFVLNSELKKLSEESLTRQPEEVFDIICKLGEG